MAIPYQSQLKTMALPGSLELTQEAIHRRQYTTVPLVIQIGLCEPCSSKGSVNAP
jgi:hypothetical protein